VQKGTTEQDLSRADFAEINAKVTKEIVLYILMLKKLAWH
jgi:hypothetical protein